MMPSDRPSPAVGSTTSPASAPHSQSTRAQRQQIGYSGRSSAPYPHIQQEGVPEIVGPAYSEPYQQRSLSRPHHAFSPSSSGSATLNHLEQGPQTTQPRSESSYRIVTTRPRYSQSAVIKRSPIQSSSTAASHRWFNQELGDDGGTPGFDQTYSTDFYSDPYTQLPVTPRAVRAEFLRSNSQIQPQKQFLRSPAESFASAPGDFPSHPFYRRNSRGTDTPTSVATESENTYSLQESDLPFQGVQDFTYRNHSGSPLEQSSNQNLTIAHPVAAFQQFPGTSKENFNWIQFPFADPPANVAQRFDRFDQSQHSRPNPTRNTVRTNLELDQLKSVVPDRFVEQLRHFPPDLTELDDFLGEALAFTTMDSKSAEEWKSSFRVMRERFLNSQDPYNFDFSTVFPNATLPRKASGPSYFMSDQRGPATFEDAGSMLSDSESRPRASPSRNLLGKSRSAADVSTWLKRIQQNTPLNEGKSRKPEGSQANYGIANQLTDSMYSSTDSIPNGDVSSSSDSHYQSATMPRSFGRHYRSPMSEFWNQTLESERMGSPTYTPSPTNVKGFVPPTRATHQINFNDDQADVNHVRMRVNGSSKNFTQSPSGTSTPENKPKFSDLNNLIEEVEKSSGKLLSPGAPWWRIDLRRKLDEIRLSAVGPTSPHNPPSASRSPVRGLQDRPEILDTTTSSAAQRESTFDNVDFDLDLPRPGPSLADSVVRSLSGSNLPSLFAQQNSMKSSHMPINQPTSLQVPSVQQPLKPLESTPVLPLPTPAAKSQVVRNVPIRIESKTSEPRRTQERPQLMEMMRSASADSLNTLMSTSTIKADTEESALHPDFEELDRIMQMMQDKTNRRIHGSRRPPSTSSFDSFNAAASTSSTPSVGPVESLMSEVTSFMSQNPGFQGNRFPLGEPTPPGPWKDADSDLQKTIEQFEHRAATLYNYHFGRQRSKSDSPAEEDIPTGLPHPKPKHHVLRDHTHEQQKQVLQDELLRQSGGASSPTGFSVGYRGFAPNLQTGSVAERVMQFERAPAHMRKETLYRTIRPLLSGSDDGSEPPPSPRFLASGSTTPIAEELRSGKYLDDLLAQSESLAQRSSNNVTTIEVDADMQKRKDPKSLINHADSPYAEPLQHRLTTLTGKDSIELDVHTSPYKVSPTLPSTPALLTHEERPAVSPTPATVKTLSGKRPVPLPEVRVPPLKPKLSDSKSRVSASQKQHEHVPKFHFPHGRPVPSNETELTMSKVKAEFGHFNNGQVRPSDMSQVMMAAEIPLYWKRPLFLKCGGETDGFITFQMFSDTWQSIMKDCHDAASRFVRLMAPKTRNYLIFEDFEPLMQDVIDTHPGLSFLREATEFHSRYVQTVIARIFYCSPRPWSWKITVPQLRRSTFLPILKSLEEIEDINQVTEYFSYEHFYVIYCKFWELDRDHDLLISRLDMERHNERAVSARVIARIFSGAVIHGVHQAQGKMTYRDFVWFLIAEEDKKHATSIEYWFRCIDRDGDGIITLSDLEFFYEEQKRKLEMRGTEAIQFIDIVCQLLDVVKPEKKFQIQLRDLKNCKMVAQFLNTFINIDKYLEAEQAEGGVGPLRGEGEDLSDWDKFAMEEYEALVQEEGGVDIEDESNFLSSSINLDDDDLVDHLSKSAPEVGIQDALNILNSSPAGQLITS